MMFIVALYLPCVVICLESFSYFIRGAGFHAPWLALRGASAGGFVLSHTWFNHVGPCALFEVSPRRAHTPALCLLESPAPSGTV